jgi:glycosyltransferase involved in cell wall biosynthesis
MTTPYPILFITANMGGGGAERAVTNILNHLDRSRFEPHLALFQKEGVFLQQLASDVPVYELQPEDRGFLHHNWTRIRAIKRLCTRINPALIMSIQWQVNIVTLVTHSMLDLDCPIVVNEQNAPRRNLELRWQGRLFWPLARRTYHRTAKIVAISTGIATELQEMLPLPSEHIQVIHNPMDLGCIETQAALATDAQSPPSATFRLIAVGRLTPQKNYPLLLNALSTVTKEEPVYLNVLGDGPDRPHLKSLVESLGIEEFVQFLGFRRNPFAYMKQADAFVLSSSFEGFGNVIVEAMALGIPVIATDCPYGPAEILDGGKYGTLVPAGNEYALAEAILSLVHDAEGRRVMGERARRRAEDFSINRIVPRYEELFWNLIHWEQI